MFFKCFLCYFVCWPQFFGEEYWYCCTLLEFERVHQVVLDTLQEKCEDGWNCTCIFTVYEKHVRIWSALLGGAFFFFFVLFFVIFLSCIYPEPVNAVVLACVVMVFQFQLIFSTTHTHCTGISCVSCAFDLRLKFQGVDLSQPIRLTDDLQPVSNWVQTPLLGQVLCKHSHGQCFLLLLLLSENSGPMHSCLRPVQFEAQQNMIGGGGEVGGSRRWLTVGSHYVE